MFIRFAQQYRLASSFAGICLVLLFVAFGNINAIDNLQHVGLTEHHNHSALSSVTMLEDHDHHLGNDDRGQPGAPSTPIDRPEHAHPNLLGNIAPNTVVQFEAVALQVAVVLLTFGREGVVTGHLQQTPDRPPKHSL